MSKISFEKNPSPALTGNRWERSVIVEDENREKELLPVPHSEIGSLKYFIKGKPFAAQEQVSSKEARVV